MINSSKYKTFLETYLDLIEKFVEELDDPVGKETAQLRVAERGLNYFFDKFPLEHFKKVFTSEEWRELKNRRDEVANKLSTIIDSNPALKKRYEFFCERLKNPSAFTADL